MTGEWGGVRTDLRRHGYDFTLEHSAMTATNISGVVTIAIKPCATATSIFSA
jgi:carbohydrate-selective porin OprB